MDDILKNFLLNAYTTIDDVYLTSDVENSCLMLKFRGFRDCIRVSLVDDNIVVSSDYYGDEYTCGDSDLCLDVYLTAILASVRAEGNSLSDDELEDSSEEDTDFVKAAIDDIVSDTSTVVLSKLMFDGKIIGYRFRLRKGCVDISLEKGRELGIVPYKIGKHINLIDKGGVFASKYECTNKVLFPDISYNDKLCRELLEVLLSK